GGGCIGGEPNFTRVAVYDLGVGDAIRVGRAVVEGESRPCVGIVSPSAKGECALQWQSTVRRHAGLDRAVSRGEQMEATAECVAIALNGDAERAHVGHRGS